MTITVPQTGSYWGRGSAPKFYIFIRSVLEPFQEQLLSHGILRRDSGGFTRCSQRLQNTFKLDIPPPADRREAVHQMKDSVSCFPRL